MSANVPNVPNNPAVTIVGPVKRLGQRQRARLRCPKHGDQGEELIVPTHQLVKSRRWQVSGAAMRQACPQPAYLNYSSPQERPDVLSMAARVTPAAGLDSIKRSSFAWSAHDSATKL